MPYKNTILKALGAETVERLRLRPVTFELEHQVEAPGTPIHALYFVETGMASLTTTFSDGAQVEVGMFGYESVIGISALMGTKQSLNRIYTQIPGTGYSSPLELARLEFARGGIFQLLALRYVQAQLVQTMQNAGCNTRHSFEQRLARWLLLCSDRAGSPTFEISQENLSHMLGGTRSTVSITAAGLKENGLIDYTRGVIHIEDAAGLEARACECYRVIRDHLENYAEFEAGPQA